MKAIEFETIIKGKTIEIPDAYAEWSEKPVRVILLREDEVTMPQSLSTAIQTFRESVDWDELGDIDDVFENVRSKDIGRVIDL